MVVVTRGNRELVLSSILLPPLCAAGDYPSVASAIESSLQTKSEVRSAEEICHRLRRRVPSLKWEQGYRGLMVGEALL
jgi:hypothetical protein